MKIGRAEELKSGRVMPAGCRPQDLTRREIFACSRYYDPHRPATDQQIAKLAGVGRRAITMRRARALAKLSTEQADRLRARHPRTSRRVRVVPLALIERE